MGICGCLRNISPEKKKILYALAFYLVIMIPAIIIPSLFIDEITATCLQIARWSKDHHPALVIFIIAVIACIINVQPLPIPLHAFTMIFCGFLLGFGLGLVAAMLGVFSAQILVYFIAQSSLRPKMLRIFRDSKYFETLEPLLRKSGWRLVCLVRASIIPQQLKNYIVGLVTTKETWKSNFAAFASVELVWICMLVWTGSSIHSVLEITHKDQSNPVQIVFTVLPIVILIILIVLAKKGHKRIMEMMKAEEARENVELTDIESGGRGGGAISNSTTSLNSDNLSTIIGGAGDDVGVGVGVVGVDDNSLVLANPLPHHPLRAKSHKIQENRNQAVEEAVLSNAAVASTSSSSSLAFNDSFNMDSSSTNLLAQFNRK